MRMIFGKLGNIFSKNNDPKGGLSKMASPEADSGLSKMQSTNFKGPTNSQI